MSASADVIARLDAWLSDGQIEGKVEQLRDLFCNVIWAGDDLHCETEAVARRVPGATGEHLPQCREAWASVGGQAAIEQFDNITRDIYDALGGRA